ncbi:HTH-type transcriptional activator Mta [Clostridium pasteurianum DSM 525 = ATCC 6013]|uniref:Antibiotic resistance transcriptional regulator, MerR family n=2 Tax=Clostridium pasteurianum TaxID=1501 RepID=A0A0H3J4T8_CLOPA|nr:HTH-type transcriptional activator Mta [Clostridium pasteurianum DSM 525 = ATCC 6013]AJA50946.1 HTH-type transcriptional activator Mta [Clostridium pasteurianum DSM 525 = ATCC 6013]KRU13045.1 antibiotic resistance transcriptional regulator, MerR family [Clostridium pasteurianum DSM 525 = ATCC 6013]
MMKTVKQVSDLTGISVRMLHYYHKIGLLKPTKLTEAGYRLYDDEALETLQQILFFKELDLPLKEIKEIITSPCFDKMKALEDHKKLIILKRDRLNALIELINKTLKGVNSMSFKEFDMTEYYNVLEEFKKENKDRVIKNWGSVDNYNEFIEKCKSKEAEIAKDAIKHYGSIKKFTEALKKNLNNSLAITKAEQMDKFKKDCLYDKHPKLKELYKKLTADLTKDPSSQEIQQIAGEITNIAKKDYEAFKTNMGDYYWYAMVEFYLVFPKGLDKLDKKYGGSGVSWIEEIDKKYGNGASKFIGKALKIYLGDYEPKIETLYKKLRSNLSKDPTSKEIQQIVSEIDNENRKIHEALKVDEGENHLGYMAEFYLSKPEFIKATDKRYGDGTSKFIGEALKFYAENNK